MCRSTTLSMNPEKPVNVRQKLTAVICCVLLAFMLLIGCIRQHRRDETARQRRSSLDNDTLSSVLGLCTLQLVPVDGTFEDMADMLADVTGDYVSLVRISMTYENGNQSESQRGNTWHWALGARGRFMLTFPYDNHSLSLTTLGFGLHAVSISWNSSHSPFDSISEICLRYALSKHLKEVRSRVKNPGGFSYNPDDDIICEERFSDSPSFSGTLIPGYSIFELQAISYYECWNVNTMETCLEDSCDINHSSRIDCTIVNVAFLITGVFLFLALCWKIYHILSKPYSSEDEVLGKNINILQIRSISPVILMSISTCLKPKLIRIVYRVLIYSIPLLIHLVAFLWYFTKVDEYAYRSDRRGEAFKRALGLDIGLANILYVSGAELSIAFAYTYQKIKEEPSNLSTKEKRLLLYAGVFILCFFRLSATAMLLVEVLILTVIGIAINIKYRSTVWINVIVGALFFIAKIIEFFDSYQHLFNEIYSLGTKVDREGNFPNKIFEQTTDGPPQTQFKIKLDVLQNIIKKRLPFWPHVFRTSVHILFGIGALVILAVVVLYVDRLAHVSSLVEYFITVIPLAFGLVVKLKGIPLTAGGKAKNHSEDQRLQLEEDLREFARTGVFPRPNASHCPSPSWHAWRRRWCPCWGCCSTEPSSKSTFHPDVQPQNP